MRACGARRLEMVGALALLAHTAVAAGPAAPCYNVSHTFVRSHLVQVAVRVFAARLFCARCTALPSSCLVPVDGNRHEAHTLCWCARRLTRHLCCRGWEGTLCLGKFSTHLGLMARQTAK